MALKIRIISYNNKIKIRSKLEMSFSFNDKKRKIRSINTPFNV